MITRPRNFLGSDWMGERLANYKGGRENQSPDEWARVVRISAPYVMVG